MHLQVYGIAKAKVSIGYEYKTCNQIVWEVQMAVLQGFDVDISDIGGWSLDVHHHYNFHEGKMACYRNKNLIEFTDGP